MLKSKTDLRNEKWKVEKESGELNFFLKQGSRSPGDRFGVFLNLVSSSNYFTESVFCFLNIEENVSFSLSNARERPPTRAASGKHGCMLARSRSPSD